MAHTHITQIFYLGNLSWENQQVVYSCTSILLFITSSLFTIQYIYDIVTSKTPNPLTRISQKP
jgi:hypothetical protein